MTTNLNNLLRTAALPRTHSERSGDNQRFPNFPESNLLKKTANPQFHPKNKILPNGITQSSTPTTIRNSAPLTARIHRPRPPARNLNISGNHRTTLNTPERT